MDVIALCQVHGKEWRDYNRLESAKCFQAALSAATTNRGGGNGGDDGLVVMGPRDEGGRGQHTFAGRQVALHCASWISPEFEVWVYDRIGQVGTGGRVMTGNNLAAPAFELAGRTLLWSFSSSYMAPGPAVATALKTNSMKSRRQPGLRRR